MYTFSKRIPGYSKFWSSNEVNPFLFLKSHSGLLGFEGFPKVPSFGQHRSVFLGTHH